MLSALHINEELVKQVEPYFNLFPQKIHCRIIPDKDIIDDGIVENRYFPYYKEYSGKYENEFFIENHLTKLYEREGFHAMSEELKHHPMYSKSEYGVCDNIEQAKDYLKVFIDDPDNEYVITWEKVEQDKSRAGQADGWRWKKWGPYIGNLKRECEYLDDEDFGDDFQGYVLIFRIYKLDNVKK